MSTTITILTTALAAGLILAVFSIQAQTYAAFTGGPIGYDTVLGARGSQLQLVLNSVFHLETSPGNIPWSLYEDVASDARVKLAVPYATGDSFRGFRIVGTTPAQFTDYRDGDGQPLKFSAGGVFDPDKGEAILGSFVAER